MTDEGNGDRGMRDRHYYYEGDDPAGFVRELQEADFAPVVMFMCPTSRIAEVERLIERGVWQLGT
jgi:hypothetical protein